MPSRGARCGGHAAVVVKASLSICGLTSLAKGCSTYFKQERQSDSMKPCNMNTDVADRKIVKTKLVNELLARGQIFTTTCRDLLNNTVMPNGDCPLVASKLKEPQKQTG